MIAEAIAPGWACLARLGFVFESALGSSAQSRRLASSNQVRQTATGAHSAIYLIRQAARARPLN